MEVTEAVEEGEFAVARMLHASLLCSVGSFLAKQKLSMALMMEEIQGKDTDKEVCSHSLIVSYD